jgi:hypothetical protein
VILVSSQPPLMKNGWRKGPCSYESSQTSMLPLALRRNRWQILLEYAFMTDDSAETIHNTVVYRYGNLRPRNKCSQVETESHKLALIDLISCAPEMFSKAATPHDIEVGFLAPGIIDKVSRSLCRTLKLF